MKNVFIIAEAGVNHNGQLDLALQLCDAAKEAGADAVKFQTWKTENIVTKSATLAEYQNKNIGATSDSQFEMLKNLELKYNDFVKIQNHCNQIGLNFMSTPDDEESLNFLLSLGLDIIKVGSGEITNIPYLRKIGNSNKIVILSTGMSYLGDVEKAYQTLIDAGTKEIILLHCTTNYPCPVEEVNLKAMLTLKEAFKCRVGYSDHTTGIEVPIAAVALGAEIIEKHFTLDKAMEGPDHRASLNPNELMQMIKSIRNIEKAMGNGIKQPNLIEKEISKIILKKIVAKTEIKRGEVLSENNLALKRANGGIPPTYWDLIEGTVAEKDYTCDELISGKVALK